METRILTLFCLSLLLCILLDLSILVALAAGLVLFLLYGRRRGFSWRELAQMSFSGIRTAGNILLAFILIGILTALWRAAGTIPVLVCYAGKLIQPSLFLVMAFLLNCLVSVLTGTAFGTAATMGVICATIAAAMQVDILLVGGAVLSGVYFGDRCSPVSTIALLVAELTGTNLFDNIRRMLRTAGVPFCAACALYAALGMFFGRARELPDLPGMFGNGFALHWIALLPAAVILALSLLQVRVKIAMTLSILTALPICVLLQHTAAADLPLLMLAGYRAADPEVSALLNGGGVASMLNVMAIVCLSSSYSGIFQRTGLLDQAKQTVRRLSRRTSGYTAMLCTALAAGMVACNQTLTILLTHQLCREMEEDGRQLAVDMEDTAVVTAPLVPWSIACAVPLASVGAPAACVLFAFFLYLLPGWRLIGEAVKKRRSRGGETDR